MQGEIVSLNIYPGQRLQKNPCAVAAVGAYGFEGDRHNRPMRWSYRRGVHVPNIDRHVSVLAQEVLDELGRTLSLKLCPGMLGENITTRGLGDLSQLMPETRLVAVNALDGTPVCVLRVVEPMQPCVKLSPLHEKFAKVIYGKRGVYCAIELGHGNLLRPADKIVAISPA